MLQREYLDQFERYLQEDEKGKATIEKYLRDVRVFYRFVEERELTKEETIAYKAYLTEHYAAASTNSMLVALNVFLRFLKRTDCCVKLLRIQRQIFSNEDQELTQAEYGRLIRAAGNKQLAMVIQTIGGTGIRVSELQYITVEAVRDGKAIVDCKNKTRVIFIPRQLKKALEQYIKKAHIQSGPVFISKKEPPCIEAPSGGP